MERMMILEKLGSNIRSRSNVERIRETMNASRTYIFDMAGVEFLSRSAADELCALSEQFHVEFQNAAGIVANMLELVLSARSKKRVRKEDNAEVINFESFEALSAFLLSM